jgi:phosphonate transport system permease protein
MSKTTAEAIENIDRRPVEAIASTGAGKISRFLFGVVPQVLPTFLGNAIFQFDINIRRAAILGMVGAGGIGLYFSEQMKSYNYGNAGACVLAVVILVVVGEVISNRIRTKLISG